MATMVLKIDMVQLYAGRAEDLDVALNAGYTVVDSFNEIDSSLRVYVLHKPDETPAPAAGLSEEELEDYLLVKDQLTAAPGTHQVGLGTRVYAVHLREVGKRALWDIRSPGLHGDGGESDMGLDYAREEAVLAVLKMSRDPNPNDADIPF